MQGDEFPAEWVAEMDRALSNIVGAGPYYRERAALAALRTARALMVPAGVVLPDIAAERERQKGKGWAAAHDDTHTEGDIIWAESWGAIARLQQAATAGNTPRGQRAMLVKAAALIVAEIERLDRLAAAAAATAPAPEDTGNEG